VYSILPPVYFQAAYDVFKTLDIRCGVFYTQCEISEVVLLFNFTDS